MDDDAKNIAVAALGIALFAMVIGLAAISEAAENGADNGIGENNVTRIIAGDNIAVSPENGYGDVTISSTGVGGNGISENNVTRIIAGDNVSISPENGYGDVTITSTGGIGGNGAALVYDNYVENVIISPGAGAWWDEDWNWKVPITITELHPDNYQVKVIVVDHPDIRADYGDVRFLESEASDVLNYWLQEYTANNATFWVKRTENADSTIFCYFGNAAATTTSNGADTFIQYHGAADAEYHDANIVTTPFIYETVARLTATTTALWGLSEDGNMNVSTVDAVCLMPSSDKRYFKTWDDGVQSYVSESPTLTLNQWYDMQIVVTAAIARAYINGNQVAAGINSNIPDEAIGLSMEFTTGTGEQEYSYARAYTATEPGATFGDNQARGVVANDIVVTRDFTLTVESACYIAAGSSGESEYQFLQLISLIVNTDNVNRNYIAWWLDSVSENYFYSQSVSRAFVLSAGAHTVELRAYDPAYDVFVSYANISVLVVPT